MRRNSASSILSERSDETLLSTSERIGGSHTERRSSLLSANSASSPMRGGFSPSSSKTSLPRTPRRSNFFQPSLNQTAAKRMANAAKNVTSPVETSTSLLPLPLSTPSKLPAAPNRVVTGFRATTIPEYKGHMPRCGHTAITYKRDFYIFGGVNNKNQYPNHLYCHEKRSLQWEEIRGVGVVPTGRANHSAVVHKNKMIIYGGHRYLDVFDDLYSYDLDARRWDKIGYEKRQGPGPVFLHAAVYIPPTQSMAIIGGFHQREYNMYVGHILDIRNRVWSGIPGPHAINLQHLQLVTATFDVKSTSIVVLGFTEGNAAFSSRMPSPYVYLMNIHSFIWTKVETSSSPESPIPFRLDIIWEKFMREFIMMGGYHDAVMHSWFFPITIESVVDAKPSKDSSSTTSGQPLNNRGGRPKYGFFKLQLDDMKWSIVPTSLPKKLMAELAQKNRDSMLQKKANQSSTSTNSANKLNTMSSSSSKAMLHNLQSSVPGDSVLLQMPTAVEVTTQKKAMLFSVEGDPQFQRKYAYAVNREGSSNSNNSNRKKTKTMQYLIMHGGLDPGMDYTMLMLTPQLSRPDAYTAARMEVDDTDSSVMLSKSGRWSDEDEDSRTNLTSSTKRRYMFDSVTSIPTEDSKSEIRLEEYLDKAKDHCLLPMMPCTQNRLNAHRFAVLFHPNNSLIKEELLAYPTTPAAILEAEKDIQQWAERYYTDTRKWLSEKLQVVVQEDKQLRRLQKRQQSRNSVTALQDGSDDDTSSSEDDAGTSGLPKIKPEKAPPPLQEHSKEAFATRRNLNSVAMEVQSDFFSKKGLYLFGLEDFTPPEEQKPTLPTPLPTPTPRDGASEASTDTSTIPTGLERLTMKVKRHQEQQRLAENVFYGEAGANTGDLGSAMALVLMQNALSDIPTHSREDRSKRALIRWRYLRALVRTGEAAFIIYRVSQEEAKMKGLAVTSNPGLLLAPELHLVGPSRPYKVSSRPIPYTVPQNPSSSSPFAEVTSCGMVVYHHLNPYI